VGNSKIKNGFYKTNFLFKISFLIFKLILQPHEKFRILENSENNEYLRIGKTKISWQKIY